MKEHPLTLEDLEQERGYLKDAGFRLSHRQYHALRFGERHLLVVVLEQTHLSGNLPIAGGP